MTREVQTVEPAWAMPATIVVTDGKIIPQQCELYRSHASAILEAHHVVPESWFRKAGKPVETPMVRLCGTCHNDTHAAIDGLLRDPPRDVSLLPPRCVRLAQRGLALAPEYGLTPAPTL